MRQTLQSLFGLDLTTAQKVIVASVVILVLLALLGLFVRQIQGGRLRLRGQGSGRTRQPRLGIVDTHDLDRQRQLVLIRRDNVEHLIMIGGSSDVVVETNIVRSGARAAAPVQPELPMLDRPMPFDSLVPAAEPSRQELGRQETGRQESGRQEPARQEPAEEQRRVVPPASIAVTPQPETLPPLPARHAQTQPEAAAGASFGAALGTAMSGSTAPAQPTTKVPTPNFARDSAPAPAVSAGELDDMARQLEEALKRPFSAVRPAHAPAEPPRQVVPSPAPPPVAAPKPAVTPAPVQVPPPVVPAPPPTPFAPPGPATSRPSDVEAELAQALGLRPERTAPRTPAPAPVVPAPAPAEPARPARLEPAVAPKPVEPAPAPKAAPAVEEVTEKPAVAEVAKVDEAKAEAEPQRKEAPAEPEPKAEPEAKAEPKPIDPFSVDAIEAEFARLLGRDPKNKS
jgi:hypothetical protein